MEPANTPIKSAPAMKRVLRTLSAEARAEKGLKALLKRFIAHPTRPEALTGLIGGLVDFELRARLKALP